MNETQTETAAMALLGLTTARTTPAPRQSLVPTISGISPLSITESPQLKGPRRVVTDVRWLRRGSFEPDGIQAVVRRSPWLDAHREKTWKCKH